MLLRSVNANNSIINIHAQFRQFYYIKLVFRERSTHCKFNIEECAINLISEDYIFYVRYKSCWMDRLYIYVEMFINWKNWILQGNILLEGEKLLRIFLYSDKYDYI